MCPILKKISAPLLLPQVLLLYLLSFSAKLLEKAFSPLLFQFCLTTCLSITLPCLGHLTCNPGTACTPFSLLETLEKALAPSSTRFQTQRAQFPFLAPALESSSVLPHLCSISCGNCISGPVFNFQVSTCHSLICIFSAERLVGSQTLCCHLLGSSWG